ncbi:MAG: hypothetical protein QNL12_05775 [Acidimicrobiia bacterium]|nr:hypothetical protein [Acidimicrobiia bacterium]MDX2466803.1 hypothetical protein [Acidimicrobiia bacterium]
MEYRTSKRTKALLSILGGVAAGSSLGALLGGVASLMTVSQRAAVASAAAFGLVIAAILDNKPIQVRTETPRSLLDRGPVAWSLLNGALLGVGVASRLGFWLWYAIPLGVLVVGSATGGAVLWGLYGFSRMTMIAADASRMHDDTALDRADSMLRRSTVMKWSTRLATFVFAGVVLGVVGLG